MTCWPRSGNPWSATTSATAASRYSGCSPTPSKAAGISPGIEAAEDLLAAAIARQRSIAATLTQLDPFYRYEVDIRTGRVRDLPWKADAQTSPGLAYAQYQQLDDEHYAVLRLIALSAESARLRPITIRANLEVSPGSPEHTAVEEFLQFGAPFENVLDPAAELGSGQDCSTEGGPACPRAAPGTARDREAYREPAPDLRIDHRRSDETVDPDPAG